MKTAVAALLLLALVPVSASADSEYATCMKMQQAMATMPNGSTPGRRGGYFNRASFGPVWQQDPTGIYFAYSLGTTYSSLRMSSDWSFGENSRVLGMTRACRHLVKVKPPAYRIVGVKSPAQRTSTNVTGRTAAPRPAPDFLPAAD